MSNFSIRAFDQAQRRHLYPERRGVLGLAYVQRDLIEAQKSLSALGASLWGSSPEEKMSPDAPSVIKSAQEHLSDAGLRLLQLSGALGIDLISLLRQRLEQEELTII